MAEGVLMLTCKSCGQEFPSGIAVDSGTHVIGSGEQLTCPQCGKLNTYDAADYHVAS
jgi:hypothetical protein